MQVLIIYGTVTGNSRTIAQKVEQYLNKTGHIPTVINSYELQPEQLMGYKILVVVTSTWKADEYNENFKPFIDRLMQTKPHLTNQYFGIIGLGDMSYGEENFCTSALSLEKLLIGLGAAVHKPIFTIDGEIGEVTDESLKNWLASLIK